MERVEPAEVWKPFLRKMSIELGVDPDYKDPSGLYPPLVEEIWSAPAVVAIWGPRRRAAQPETDTATANAAHAAAAASANDEGVATTSREAGQEATNADKHSVADSEAGSGLDGPASAPSSPVMPNDPRSPRPSRPTLIGPFAVEPDVLSTPRPAAQLPQTVPRGVQTTPNPTASPQQARALTTDSLPASAARLADNQESSAPAAPKTNPIFNAGPPGVTCKRKALEDLIDDYLRATCYRENSPPPPAATPGAGFAGYRFQRAKLSHRSMQQFLTPLQGVLSALPAPASPAAACNTPNRPSSSGASSPPPFHGTRTGRSVDPNQDVTPLELPPAVYSVPFIAPKRILVDASRERSEKLPVTCLIKDEHMTVLRDAHPEGDDRNADASKVADVKDEPVEHGL